MSSPAENVLLIYDRATRKLLRRVIPDFKNQEDDPSFYALGEGMIKVPISVHNSWRSDSQRRAEQYILANAV